MRIGAVLVAGLFILSAGTSAYADTLAQNTSGTGSLTQPFYLGQSFLVVGTGTYTDVTFNFYSPAGGPVALGTGFLFSTPYSGTPAGLNSSDPGFLGSAAASGNEYNFGTSVDLAAGVEYYFYENGQFPTGGVAGGSGYSGGEAVSTTSATADFGDAGGSANFLVTGEPTPEPSSLLLLGTGVLGLAGAIRRRFV